MSPTVTASVNMGSIGGSAGGAVLYGCCFSTATVSLDGLPESGPVGAI